MEPDDLLCSRNARPLKALVRRAQWKINQPPSPKRKRASLEGSSVPRSTAAVGPTRGALPDGTTSKLGGNIYISVVVRRAQTKRTAVDSHWDSEVWYSVRMPKTPLLGTIISFKDVTGNSCTVEQLKTFLSPHNRSEVLFLCALLNTVLETWAGKVREDVHGQLVEMAFLPEHATRLKKIISSSSHPKVVFHRAQIIFVAKQAVLCCQDDETVLDRFRHPYWGGLGLAFLMANDLLHFDFAYRDGTTNQQALIRMTHSIPLLESGITPFSNKIGRAWLMLKKFGPAPSSRSYFNIEEAFHRTAGLSVEEYLAFCVGIFSHYLSLNFEQIAKMEDSIGLIKEWFTTAHINPISVDRFLEDVSAPPATFATRFLSRDWGPLDMTWFRDKPVFRLKGSIFVALDAKYLAGKLDSGIFWRVHSSLHNHKDKEQLHNYWGVAFENYMNWLLEQACKNSENKFYASPRYENGNEVCDAIIVCGSDAVFIEYKGSTFTAESKYRGAHWCPVK